MEGEHQFTWPAGEVLSILNRPSASCMLAKPGLSQPVSRLTHTLYHKHIRIHTGTRTHTHTYFYQRNHKLCQSPAFSHSHRRVNVFLKKAC